MRALLPTLAVLALPFLAKAQCTASFTFDGTDLTIQFTDQSTSQPGDPIVSWFWDFDDGTTSTEQNPLHTFPEPDKYDVVLTITTASGCTAEIEIRIEICTLNVGVTVGACDNNGNVPLTITVQDIYDNADEVDISVDGQLLPGSPFQISAANPVTVNTTVPGDGLSHTIVVQSTDIPTCNETVDVTVPDCNSNCFLSAIDVQFAGGTTQTVEVGTGGNNVFTPAQLTITIGDLVEFVWVDNGHSTTSDATSGPDAWNSGVIGIGSVFPVTIHNPGVHPYYCIPHGGPGGAGMAGTIIANCPSGNNIQIEVTFNTSVADPAGFDLKIDGVTQAGSPFPYNGTGPQSVTATIAGDGQTHTIEIVDVADPTCMVSTTWTAPNCGAAPACQLSLTAQENGPCNANNEVPVDVTVTDINGGAGGFNLLVDGVQVAGGPFAYNASGTTVVTIDVAGDGQSHTIEAVDVDDPTCSGSTTLTTTNCAIPCVLSNLTASTGTATTHVVEVQDFQFVPQHVTITSGDVVEWHWVGAVQHTSTSDATSGPDSWDSGLLGPGATYTSPVLSTGVHPYYCIPHGAPGGVGMAGTITVQANCTNGLVSVNVTFNEQGGGFNGYEVLVDGVSAGTYGYDPSGTNSVSVPVAGDGQSHVIEVRDVDDATCSVSTGIVTPDCNASTCQLTVSAQESGPCDANDADDDELCRALFHEQLAGSYRRRLATDARSRSKGFRVRAQRHHHCRRRYGALGVDGGHSAYFDLGCHERTRSVGQRLARAGGHFQSWLPDTGHPSLLLHSAWRAGGCRHERHRGGDPALAGLRCRWHGSCNPLFRSDQP